MLRILTLVEVKCVVKHHQQHIKLECDQLNAGVFVEKALTGFVHHAHNYFSLRTMPVILTNFPDNSDRVFSSR